MLNDVDGVLEYFPGVSYDLIGPKFVCGHGYSPDPIAQTEDDQFGREGLADSWSFGRCGH